MLLVFEGMGADELVRPAQVAAVLTALEEIFLVTLLRDAPPPDHRGASGRSTTTPESLQIGLDGAALESPLHILLALPWHVYTVPFSAFAYGVAHVFGAPSHRRAPLRSRARGLLEQPPRRRQPRSAEWMEWQAWLEYKHEEVVRTGAVPPAPRSTSS